MDTAVVSEHELEPEVGEVLRLLAARKNVILSGPPGAGKSRLLNRVKHQFVGKTSGARGDLFNQIAIPGAHSVFPDWYPSPTQTKKRKSFSTVFDQNTKYRDFVRGLVPAAGRSGEFMVSAGTLYRAAEFARIPGNAALVVIDEINRGPAVAAFGSALVALEEDKRLPTDGNPTPETQSFEILDNDGLAVDYTLPTDLYILAAMNEADSSVEPLDVAFLRRFHVYRLEPTSTPLWNYFGIDDSVSGRGLSPVPASSADWIYALIHAFEKINDKITLGRGQVYRLGHGALMQGRPPHSSSSLEDTARFVAGAWDTIYAHINEVFFGDSAALADLLEAEHPEGPYRIVEGNFAGRYNRQLVGPSRLNYTDLYTLLRVIATS